MKKLVFNFHFCLLITLFVFVATQAMAIVEITVSGFHTPDDGQTTQDESQIVIILSYDVTPDSALTADDFTLDATTVFSDGADNDPKTYTISKAANKVTFTLTGYLEVVATGTAAVVSFSAGVTSNKLTYANDYLPGLGYAIVAKNDTAIASGVYPTLPTITYPDNIRKIAWADMPDLHTLFSGGGSLNLRVNEPGTGQTGNRLGSKQADDTYDDDHNRNQRQVVINEVMWAHDSSFIGTTPANLIREQWIEIYNRTTTPIAFTDIKYTTSKQFPGPKPETDMLSNVPNYVDTWTIAGKGQHGSSVAPLQEFKSMQRVNYNNGWVSTHWSIATLAFLRNYSGTPGKQNRAATVPTARSIPNEDNPDKDRVIINEIANLSNDELDWIELQNVTGSSQWLGGWVLTITTGFGNESEIVRFPDISIPARSVLLLVNNPPSETPLSMGFDVEMTAANQEFGTGPHKFLKVDDNKLAIPNDDQWLLILRSGQAWDVGGGRNIYQTGHQVEDVAGPGALHSEFVILHLNVPVPLWENKADGTPDGQIWHTKAFPLNGNLQLDANFLQSDRLNSADKVWVRDGRIQGHLKDAWTQAAFTGIGYDRNVRKNDQNSGTPGYVNSVTKGKLRQLGGGETDYQ